MHLYKKFSFRHTMTLSIVIFTLLCFVLLSGCYNNSAYGSGGENSDEAWVPDGPELTLVPDASNNTPPPENSNLPTVPDDSNTADPSGDTGDSLDALPTQAPAVHWPGVVENEVLAQDDYFNDAAFIGNSLMVGFQMYSGLSTGDYFATVSASVFTSDTLLYGLYEKSYGKVYIMLGINEIGYSQDVFRDGFSVLLDTIRQAQPQAIIYILAITPVTASKSASDEFFNMSRIWDYNGLLYSLASEKGCYFLDLCSALADEDGFLPSDASFDGIHMTPAYYANWLYYLRRFYLPSPVAEVPQEEALPAGS